MHTFWNSWYHHFCDRAEARAATGDPSWPATIPLSPTLARSLRRFQLGEDGEGAHLIAKAVAAGNTEYTAAIRLFVAEEQNHARLLGEILDRAGVPRLTRHWSDAVFVAVRRLSGLRTELVTLMVAEGIALGFYQALRDGAEDQTIAEVARRLRADEEVHVPFHRARLIEEFAHSGRLVRAVAMVGWWVIVLGALTAVLVDHGSALRELGVRRSDFASETLSFFRRITLDVLNRGTLDESASGENVLTVPLHPCS